MSATNRGERGGADPLAAALGSVLNRRGKNYLDSDELGFARQLREVAQICWMEAGEPKRLRSEDADRAAVCRSLVGSEPQLLGAPAPRGQKIHLVRSSPD